VTKNGLAAALCLLVLILEGDAAAARPQFFVFDNGVGRGSWTPEQQAKTVKELGYDGISYNYTTPEDLAKWQKALGDQGLKLFGLYVYTWFDKTPNYDPRLPEAIRMLKGSDTVLWITVREAQVKGDHDAEAVRLVQGIADLARESGVRVALYGHANFYVENGADAARIAAKANRPNLGPSINLCHEFMSGAGDRLDETLKNVAPLATLVSINGLDVASKEYVMRLDRGDFDVTAYLAKLQAAGYAGPIGLQCYNVKGDVRENLAANIATWRRMAGQLEERSSSAAPQNTLTAAERAAGWRLLFDGKTTSGWRGFQKKTFPADGWVVEHGTLKGLGRKGGDILSTATFTDFEFAWEWRLSFQGNSGVKYFVDEARGNATGAIGHEYQMIDDENYALEPLTAKQKTGGWYDVLPPLPAAARPVGEWNQSRILVRGKDVEHWLNGTLTAKFVTDSPESLAGIAASKFKDVPGYADKITTPVLLQDHNTVVWFRNLKVRELTAR
jgi:sugar phosphate isomerase/epimerase